MPVKKFYLAALILLAACFTGRLVGQELQGTINGTITDSTGAVVPNAQITITQQEGNIAPRTYKADQQGFYTATNLPAGDYTVTISSPGFARYRATHVVLFVSQTRTVNAKLPVGKVQQTVDVRQNAEAVDTTTSALEGTISGTQVRELQLNNRNFEQLVALQPGVVSALPDEPGFGLSNTTALAVNGARDTANNWTVDGADVNDSGSNATLLNVPSIDAIQEFTMERSTYDAEFSRSGAGQILLETKSGTSAFHGDAYEFDRNTDFNANSYFNKQTNPITPRAIEHYNDFGFTIGGPLYVPHKFNANKDKYFFFWSEEWRKVSSPQTATFNVPTPEQLAGVMAGNTTADENPSQAANNCVTYNATTGNSTINPSCYSQNAKVYLTNMYDKFTSNVAGNPNEYTAAYTQLNNTREDLVRFDAQLSQKVHFFAHAIQDETPENFPLGLFEGGDFPGVAGSAVNAPGENVVGNLTWTISPRLVNEAEYAYTQGSISSSFTPGSITLDPSVTQALTNETAFTDPYGRIPGIGFESQITGYGYGSTPYFERNLDNTLFDNFSMIEGQHTIRFGATASQMLKTENASSGAAFFEFNGWQDFLLGNDLYYTQQSRDTIPDLHYTNFEAYIQDDWQITPKLTINMGIRYSFFPSPADVLDTLVNFDPRFFTTLNEAQINPTTGNIDTPGLTAANYENGLIYPTGADCSLAQQVNGSQATCSPWGSHVDPDPKDNFAPRIGFAYNPFGDSKTSIRGGYGIFFDRMLNGIWEQNGFQESPGLETDTIYNSSFDDPTGPNSPPLYPNRITATGTPVMKNPSYWDYNLTVEHQLAQSLVASIGYVGTMGRHLLGEREINQPTLQSRESNPNAWVTAVMPYRGYAAFEDRIPGYNSNYSSLQIALNARDFHGLTLGLAYTWSKTMTNLSNDRGQETYDTYDLHKDYGASELNQPQTFILTYVYDLPFMKLQHGAMGHLLGGWEISGITNLISGMSQTVTQYLDNFDSSDCSVISTYFSPNEPNNPACPTTGLYPGGLNMDASDIAPRPDQIGHVKRAKTQLNWFSADSFADAWGHFGDTSNGSFIGPGQDLWDMALMKNLQLGSRARFQFRAEFFNVFNHNSFNAVGTVTDSYYNFGQAISSHDPREIQLGGKMYF
ncbi:MAG: carboxypeptidase regulatory-like domain-containing protein [Acidobacteriaceae bacterium]